VLALPAVSLIGKRYTILISLTLFLATCLWSAEATSYPSLRNSRILGGVAGGLIEALGPSIVFESFPEHQLARAMAVYVGHLAAGSSLGPLVAGAVAEGLDDWRWYLRILAVVIALNLAGSIVMLPETTHGANEVVESLRRGDESSKPVQSATEDINSAIVDAFVPTPDAMVASQSFKEQWLARSFSPKYVHLDWRLALHSFYRPLLLIILPEVLVTTLVFGLTIGWTVLISNILAIKYGQPPLLWGPLPIGLMSIGPLVGLIIGMPFSGALADYLFN
jgi:MFS family permease